MKPRSVALIAFVVCLYTSFVPAQDRPRLVEPVIPTPFGELVQARLQTLSARLVTCLAVDEPHDLDVVLELRRAARGGYKLGAFHAYRYVPRRLRVHDASLSPPEGQRSTVSIQTEACLRGVIDSATLPVPGSTGRAAPSYAVNVRLTLPVASTP